MTAATLALSHDLQGIARDLDKAITNSAGERFAFALLVFTPGRASYVSTASREDSVRELKRLLACWEADMPDVPAHDYT
jgi:hypothetical protein